MSYVDDLAALVNALVEDKAKELAARKTGKPVPGGVGSSLGGTTLSTDGVIDQGENTGGGGGEDDNNEDAEEPFKNGDEPEKLKLFDCETGEEVTIDGIGGGGAGPAYPTGFDEEMCKQTNPCDFTPDTYVVRMIINETQVAYFGQTEATTCSKAGGSLNGLGICIGTAPSGNEFSAGFTWLKYSDLTPDQQNLVCDVRWPAVDRNHLVWNAEKECMEPLCPNLNNQVSDKYKGCSDEMILCDEDGNKVKVEIDGGEMKITQAKHNQKVTVKDGKVTNVEPLSPEDTAREFK